MNILQSPNTGVGKNLHIGEDRPRTGFIIKDREERYNSKHAWWVNAWRIVDEEGKDIVQPWSRTKGAARALAKQLGIVIKSVE